MSASKTLNLLAVAHNYRTQGKRAVTIKAIGESSGKPNVDRVIMSRCGLAEAADIVAFPTTTHLTSHELNLITGNVPNLIPASCVLVDEAQFLDPEYVDCLRELTVWEGVPVICYGLRTDFRRELFPGSRRLLEVADSIEEVKVTCATCNRKAIYSMRINDAGTPIMEGDRVLIDKDRYAPACHSCYKQRTEDQR
jgi:thymidine kinase